MVNAQCITGNGIVQKIDSQINFHVVLNRKIMNQERTTMSLIFFFFFVTTIAVTYSGTNAQPIWNHWCSYFGFWPLSTISRIEHLTIRSELVRSADWAIPHRYAFNLLYWIELGALHQRTFAFPLPYLLFARKNLCLISKQFCAGKLVFVIKP